MLMHASASVPTEEYEIPGYTFRGWSKTDYSNNISGAEALPDSALYKANDTIEFDDIWTDPAMYVEPEKPLYAVWKRNEYKIILHRNDATENNGSTKGAWNSKIIDPNQLEKVATMSVKYDSQITTFPTDGRRDGYTFNKFATRSDIPVDKKATYSNLYETTINNELELKYPL